MIQTHALALGGSALSKFRMVSNSTYSEGFTKEPYYDEETMEAVARAARKFANDNILINTGGGAHAKHSANLAMQYHGATGASLISPPKSLCLISSDAIEGGAEEIINRFNNELKHTAATFATLANALALIKYLRETAGFGDEVYPLALRDYKEDGIRNKIFGNSRIAVTGGYLPGVGTTDASALEWFRALNATNMVKVSDYEKLFDIPISEFDPEKIDEYKATKGLELDDTFFDHVRTYILEGRSTADVPNGSYALDPVAARVGAEIAERDPNFVLKIGKIGQLEAMLGGEKFEGTRIRGTLY